jgi:hypothetical protein
MIRNGQEKCANLKRAADDLSDNEEYTVVRTHLRKVKRAKK